MKELTSNKEQAIFDREDRELILATIKEVQEIKEIFKGWKQLKKD